MENELSFKSSYSQIVNISLLITSIVCSVLLIIGLVTNKGFDLSLSFLIGALTNIWGLTLIKNDIIKKFNYQGSSKNKYDFSNNILRYFIYGIVLFVSTQKATLNPIIVATGFLTVKIAIYIYAVKHKNN